MSKTLWKKQNFETHFHFNFYEPFELDNHPTLVLHQLLQTNETNDFDPPSRVTTQHWFSLRFYKPMKPAILTLQTR